MNTSAVLVLAIVAVGGFVVVQMMKQQSQQRPQSTAAGNLAPGARGTAISLGFGFTRA